MLKIDIEGAEYQVVRDIQDALGLVEISFLNIMALLLKTPS
jgi:hypothetical protein